MKLPSFAAAAALLLGMGSAHAADPAPANGWVVSAYTLPPAGVAQPTHDAGIIAEGIFLAPGKAASVGLLKPYLGFEPGNMVAWHFSTNYRPGENLVGNHRLKVAIGSQHHPSVKEADYAMDCAVLAQSDGMDLISDQGIKAGAAEVSREIAFAIGAPGEHKVDVWVACNATRNPQVAALQMTARVLLTADGKDATKALFAHGVRAAAGSTPVLGQKKEVPTDGLPVRPGLLMTPATGMLSRGDLSPVIEDPRDFVAGGRIVPAHIAREPDLRWPEVKTLLPLQRSYVFETLIRADEAGMYSVGVVLQPDNDPSLREKKPNESAVHIAGKTDASDGDELRVVSSVPLIASKVDLNTAHPVLAAGSLYLEPGYHPVKITIDAKHLIRGNSVEGHEFSHGNFAYGVVLKRPSDVALNAGTASLYVECTGDDPRCPKQPEAPAAQPAASETPAASGEAPAASQPAPSAPALLNFDAPAAPKTVTLGRSEKLGLTFSAPENWCGEAVTVTVAGADPAALAGEDMAALVAGMPALLRGPCPDLKSLTVTDGGTYSKTVQ